MLLLWQNNVPMSIEVRYQNMIEISIISFLKYKSLQLIKKPGTKTFVSDNCLITVLSTLVRIHLQLLQLLRLFLLINNFCISDPAVFRLQGGRGQGEVT